MAYFYNNKVYDYYQVDDFITGSQSFVKDAIEIINNESILFDFTKLDIRASSIDILNYLNVEIVKIHIDWGDGQEDKLSKPLVSQSSSIGVFRPDGWKVVSHTFNVAKRYQDGEQNAIVVTAFNTHNDKVIIKIPYSVVYKTIYDLGSEFSVFSANTTNTNQVSYTLKQLKTDSMFVVNSQDWRKIYMDEIDSTIHDEVSDVFSDEFVNEDMLVWDWKTPPTIELTVNKIGNTIICNFIETGVQIETWLPRVELIKDCGNETIKAVKDDELEFKFSSVIPNGDVSVEWKDEDYYKGVYTVSVNPLSGINGVVGASSVKYLLHGTSIKPRQLMKIEGVPVIEIDNVNKAIHFNYTLDDIHQLKSLTNAKLVLVARYSDPNKRLFFIDDLKFEYDLLKPLFDTNGVPLYVKNEDGTVVEHFQGDRPFKFSIPMRNIPNIITNEQFVNEPIQYTLGLKTNDVFGGNDNERLYIPLGSSDVGEDDPDGGVCKVYPLEDEWVEFSYDVGEFVKHADVVDQDSLLFVTPQDKFNKTFELLWNFKTYDIWDQFIVKVWDNKGVLISQDTFDWDSLLGAFYGLTTDYDGGTIKGFRRKYDGNLIPNGDTKIEVTYNVRMGDYYAVRSKSETIQYQYEYSLPDITLDDIQPFTIVSYDKITNKTSLSLGCNIKSDYDEEQLKNIEIYLNDSKLTDLKKMDYYYPFIKSAPKTYRFFFRACCAKDTRFRFASTLDKSLVVKNDVTRLLTLPNNGVDYIGEDVREQFEIVDETNLDKEGSIVDWYWVKSNTLQDVDKRWSFGSGIVGGELNDAFGFVWKDSGVDIEVKKRVLYKVITLRRDDGSLVRRYTPYTDKTDLLPSPSELKTCDQLFFEYDEHGNPVKTPWVTTSYDRFSDKGNLLIDFPCVDGEVDFNENPLEVAKIQNAWINLYKNDVLVRQEDIRGKKQFQFTMMDFGDYSYNFTVYSELVKSDDYLSSTLRCKLLVPANQTIVFSGVPSKTKLTNTSVQVMFQWNLYHTSYEDGYFYCLEYDENEDVIQTREFKDISSQHYVTFVFQSSSTIKYGFMMKGQYIDGEKDEKGFIKVNEGTLALS